MIHLSNNTVSYGQKYCQISLAYSCKDKRGPYSKVKKKTICHHRVLKLKKQKYIWHHNRFIYIFTFSNQHIVSQADYIKDIAKYGLENDQEKLLSALNELIDHSKKTKKLNFAIQLQSILKESLRNQGSKTLTKVGSESYFNRIDEREISDLILEKLTSDYRLENIVADAPVFSELKSFIEEHRKADLLHKYNLPIANKLLLHGPSGCGKTLASYVIAGELNKMMVVVISAPLFHQNLERPVKIWRKYSVGQQQKIVLSSLMNLIAWAKYAIIARIMVR
jgi:hypothetical protein